ncbi:hypothetical protein K402DRAFT_391626 [Aulographum hederae CBS 113979]|uniref:Copper acquisition factor BIM1-like domain-containing protein n=1 Tax=Aulographum hederae CBS 113979 TaxID=1176131 RepID=A0A6G1H784_9PEZI|nr:hypothetical protein K402DRAFT_391626 [Aulographum hederae CBS 113979]
METAREGQGGPSAALQMCRCCRRTAAVMTGGLDGLGGVINHADDPRPTCLPTYTLPAASSSPHRPPRERQPKSVAPCCLRLERCHLRESSNPPSSPYQPPPTDLRCVDDHDPTSTMLSPQILLAIATTWSFASAHTVITYPGWRGNTLHSSGQINGMGQRWNETTDNWDFPYGQQWIYPCGGMPTSTNRTFWPTTGGALAWQPGWFSGHQFAYFYVNLGVGTEPDNMSHPMLPVFSVQGPANVNFSGELCLPQVPLPANLTFNDGDNATIQIIEVAQHGASLYSCVDITFKDPGDALIQEVGPDNCKNASVDPNTGISFDPVYSYVYTMPIQSAAASLLPSLAILAPAVIAALFSL